MTMLCPLSAKFCKAEKNSKPLTNSSVKKSDKQLQSKILILLSKRHREQKHPKSSYPLLLLKRTSHQNNNHPPSLLPPHSFPPAIKVGTGTVNETQFTVLYSTFNFFCFNKYTFLSYFLLRLMFFYILYTN
ncbi:hypothetical protein GDO81_008249 [Engystomops pustulosus]|uniref:Uncharacterized protein n=1 Tax=Engystomops pustulosus TaxID=76066 RepID=A0AAV7CD93_ENGPU|nr:hypothetical protein GDO81_008249 [Engystomops pustulosus]